MTSCQLHQHFTCSFFETAFLYLQLGFVNFWQKNTGPNDAHKMLVILNEGFNFAKILQSAFSHKSVFRSFSLLAL